MTRCNLCGGEHHVEVARRDRYGYPIALRLCAACGLGFLSPRPTAEAYAASTATSTARWSRPTTAGASTPRPSRTSSAATPPSLRAWIARTTPHGPASVLDVGGSTGVVAAAFAAPT